MIRETSKILEQIVAKVDEINIEIGLNIISNNKDKYVKILGLFYKQLKQYLDDISTALNDEDMKTFFVLIHSMKTTLATVGCIELSELALKLEVASRNNDVDYCKENFQTFNKRLHDVHEKLSIIFVI